MSNFISKIFLSWMIIFFIIGCGIDKKADNNEFDTSKIYTVDATGNGDYLTLEAALEVGALKIYVKNGVYELDETIILTDDDMSIEGESESGVQFIQTNSQKDLIVVKSSNVTIKNMTFDALTNNAQAAFVEAGSSYLTLDNVTILGGSNTFAVYFAGPPVSPEGSNCEECVDADETIEVYLRRDTTYDFSKYNVIKNCTISSIFEGDGISFSLQQHGQFINNTITGAMISVYMDRDTIVSGNTFSNSLQSGIYVSLPSENVTITGNTIINPYLHGIVVMPQYAEHGHINEGIVSSNITISENTVYAKVNGISVQGYNADHATWGSAEDINILDNLIYQYDFMGIWLYDLSDVEVSGNIIEFGYTLNSETISCDHTTRGADNGVVPNISARSSAGIHLHDFLSNVTVTENQISKTTNCDNINVMQNAVTVGFGTDYVADVTSVSVTNNTFSNYVDDWMHSSASFLDTYIFVDDSEGASLQDLSSYASQGSTYFGIDFQYRSLISNFTVSGNVDGSPAP